MRKAVRCLGLVVATGLRVSMRRRISGKGWSVSFGFVKSKGEGGANFEVLWRCPGPWAWWSRSSNERQSQPAAFAVISPGL